MRRILGTTALTVALTLTVSGCSLWKDGENVVGQVQEGFAAHAVLAELTDELRELDDITSADAGVNQIYQTAGVTVTMNGDAPASVVADVMMRVDEALRRAELQPYKREFDIRAGQATILQRVFDRAPVDYLAEFEYWHAVRSAIGPDISFILGNDRAGGDQRILSTEVDATIAVLAEHYDLLVTLEPPNAIETVWRMPGIAGYADWLGPLPERSILTVLADMATVTNLLDDSVPETPPGFIVGLSSNPTAYPPRFMLVTNAPGTSVDAAASRPLVLRAVRGALGAGLTEFQVGIASWNGEDYTDATVHGGDCVEVNPPSPADLVLVADLAAGGIPVAGIAAGICLAFAAPTP